MGLLGNVADKLKIWAMLKVVEQKLGVKLSLKAEDIMTLDRLVTEMQIQNYANFDLLSSIYVKLYGQKEFDAKMKDIKARFQKNQAELMTVAGVLAENVVMCLAKLQEQKQTAIPPGK